MQLTKFTFSLSILTLSLGLVQTALATDTCQLPHKTALPEYEYKLHKVMEVSGRQGITTDGKYLYVSGSTTLAKYDMDGKLVHENKTPFVGYQKEANHIGDIDIYNNELYVSSEWFADGVGTNIQIAIHDANTLALKRAFDFNPDSGQVEVSGITVDTVNQSIWMASWVGEESGRYLYEYDLETGKYKRKVHLQPVPQWIQGVFAYEGKLYLTADDGTADEKEHDHLYRVEISNKNNEGRVVLERTLDDVKDYGEIEGLVVNPMTKQMIIHSNRGKQIVLGMPKGFYPGYDREINELYFYDMKPRCEK
ncbi:YncE family protein [Pasteurella oralis]|uniref:YncE family protein n=1 Tax=Pasteurella oralis TaxID=1071947 RepID=A0ABW4NSA1_9PAST